MHMCLYIYIYIERERDICVARTTIDVAMVSLRLDSALSGWDRSPLKA